MTTYGFTLHVEGVPDSDDGFEAFCNALFEYAPDSTPGVTKIGFDRRASSLREAVVSAVANVRRADPAVTVTGVVLDDGRMFDALLGAPEPAGAAGGK